MTKFSIVEPPNSHLDGDIKEGKQMKFTYDTETDSISSPDLDPEQTAAIQATLARALYRNDSVQDVAKLLLETARTTKP